MSDLKLAAEFPGLTRDDWMKRVEAVLKGASFEEKLVRTTPDGIRLEPLHGQRNGPRAARHAQTPWTLFQRADHPDAARANETALDDLENGATGLVLVASDAATGGAQGALVRHPARQRGVVLHRLLERPARGRVQAAIGVGHQGVVRKTHCAVLACRRWRRARAPQFFIWQTGRLYKASHAGAPSGACLAARPCWARRARRLPAPSTTRLASTECTYI